MKKKLLTLAGLLISGTILAQDGGTIMKKYENQLPQEGRGNVHVAYQGKAIDQMIYESMEEQGMGRYERKRMGHIPANENDGSRIWAYRRAGN